MDAQFETAFTALRNALNTNDDTHQYYNTALPGFLRKIHQDLEGILASIRGLIAKNRGDLDVNQAEIASIMRAKEVTEMRIRDVTTELAENQAELASAREEREQLEEAFRREQTELTRRLNMFEAKLAADTELSEKEKMALRNDIEKTRKELQKDKEEFAAQKANMDRALEDMVNEIETEKRAVASLQADVAKNVEEIDRLQEKAGQLEEKLQRAIMLMTEATDRINSFTTNKQPNENQIRDIQLLIIEIQQELSGSPLSEALQGSAASRASAASPLPALSSSAITEINVEINGKTYKNTDINEALTFLSIDDPSQWDSIYDEYIEINKGSAENLSNSIQQLINKLTPAQKTELTANLTPYRGGRKSRRHKKRAKKTKRKQKGGYKYRNNTRRISVNTYRRSRRSSRKTSSR